MLNKIFNFFLFCATCLIAQNDTIFSSDTIITSVRIMNQDQHNLKYFYLDSNTKKTNVISLEKVNHISYENNTIEVFCDVVSKKKFLGTKEIITVNYGDRDSLWLDERIYTLTSNELKKFDSIIDALNYMGNEGWQTINSYSTSHNSYIVEHYILKKEIKK